MQDRYGNTLSTASDAARDAYVAGVDLFLAAQPGVGGAFEGAVGAGVRRTAVRSCGASAEQRSKGLRAEAARQATW